MPKSIKFHLQPDSMDCGPACLAMIAEYYGSHYTAHLQNSVFRL
jgi:ABC-type bacteriocin/lantibiotic exporter with double-glycine peptidase domain